MTQIFQSAFENRAFERRFDCSHPAANINADSRRNHRVFCRNDRADHRADSEMRVRHQRDVFIETRQARDVAQHIVFVG
jgi:hypothetical protein